MNGLNWKKKIRSSYEVTFVLWWALVCILCIVEEGVEALGEC